MGKRDDLIALYANDLRDKGGVAPDMNLLTKVAIGLGPAIYRDDSSVVAGAQPSELETIKANFLMKKLGLPDGPDLMAGINAVIDQYGRANRNKHRAVVYYLLTRRFGREGAYA
jgi:uncharacterized protein DUF2853